MISGVLNGGMGGSGPGPGGRSRRGQADCNVDGRNFIESPVQSSMRVVTYDIVSVLAADCLRGHKEKTMVRMRPQSRSNRRISVQTLVWSTILFFLFLNVAFFWHVWRSMPPRTRNTPAVTTASSNPPHPTCPLRHYPPHRYYRLDQKPDFLLKDQYIYGEWPISLDIAPTKLCVDQSEWHSPSEDQLPFADGTNPSLLRVDRLPNLKLPDDVVYLATVCMTNSQCAWRDTPAQIRDYRLSTQTQPDTVRTVLLFLRHDFSVVRQSTLFLHLDALWGKLKARKGPDGKPVPALVALDDARLFVHRDQLWVSYREGKGFGYDAQVLNRIHLSSSRTWLLASETTHFCCGRNMALMANHSNPQQLLALTWVDPVTVISVDPPQAVPPPKPNKKRQSHIHGTNAFMVEWHNKQEFLGIAHFHRPPGRASNDYARFGHHYTHAFFTIRDGQLTGLSPEFVLGSNAEIIQFLSGLEVDGDTVIVAYGINDCEAAVTRIPIREVEQLLRPVAPGLQVYDLMKTLPVSNSTAS